MRALLLCFSLVGIGIGVGVGCGSSPSCADDNVDCVVGAHWDPDQCACVLPDAGAEDCSGNCGGGGVGCAAQCTGCKSGELCCAYAGGACIPDADGGCSAASGYHCATATNGGCPNQCYP